MSILHTVNKSPFERNALERCMEYASEGAAVLLIEDGVYAARSGSAWADRLGQLDGVQVYALGPDLAARGIAKAALAPDIEVVDYPGFVELTTRHDLVQSWF